MAGVRRRGSVKCVLPADVQQQFAELIPVGEILSALSRKGPKSECRFKFPPNHPLWGQISNRLGSNAADLRQIAVLSDIYVPKR
jgi:hypothetical protein